MTGWLAKETRQRTTALPILIGVRSDFLLADSLDARSKESIHFGPDC